MRTFGLPLRFDLAIQLQNLIKTDVAVIEVEVILLRPGWYVPVLKLSQTSIRRLRKRLLHGLPLNHKALTPISRISLPKFQVLIFMEQECIKQECGIDYVPTLIIEDLLDDKILLVLGKFIHDVALIDIFLGDVGQLLDHLLRQSSITGCLQLPPFFVEKFAVLFDRNTTCGRIQSIVL